MSDNSPQSELPSLSFLLATRRVFTGGFLIAPMVVPMGGGDGQDHVHEKMLIWQRSVDYVLCVETITVRNSEMASFKAVH